MKAKAVVIWICAYLYGSMPVIDIVARTRSIDLKEVGSGNVGATNLMSVAGVPIAIVGWLVDASKGLIPVLVARRLGLTASEAGLAGVCGTAGQCWPITLGFSAGRGISAFIGASLAMEPRCWTLSLIPFICGALWRMAPPLMNRANLSDEIRARRSRSVPLGSLLGVLAFPASICVLRRQLFLPAAALAATIVMRRVTAPLPDDVIQGPSEESSAFVYRLLYDRNTAA